MSNKRIFVVQMLATLCNALFMFAMRTSSYFWYTTGSWIYSCVGLLIIIWDSYTLANWRPSSNLVKVLYLFSIIACLMAFFSGVFNLFNILQFGWYPPF